MDSLQATVSCVALPPLGLNYAYLTPLEEKEKKDHLPGHELGLQRKQ